MIAEEEFAGKRALVADDYTANQEIVQEMLESLGFRVDVAGNGQQALDLYHENSYDILLLDIDMPFKNGFEVTGEIRKKEGLNKQTKIVALTANAMPGDKEKCLAAGMDGYLSKPTEIKKLRAKLSEILLNT